MTSIQTGKTLDDIIAEQSGQTEIPADIEPTPVAAPVVAPVPAPVAISSAFDLAQTHPAAAFERASELVKIMAARCTGPQFVVQIQNRAYPKVEWWTTVGSALGLFPVEISSTRKELDNGGYMYEAVVEVRHNGTLVTRASHICSTDETAWGRRDEYAVKSMACTRATGKAYRIGLSSLAVMAGLEPTPADEIPPQGFPDQTSQAPSQAPSTRRLFSTCPRHNVEWFMTGRMKSPAHPYDDNGKQRWCNMPRQVATLDNTDDKNGG